MNQSRICDLRVAEVQLLQIAQSLEINQPGIRDRGPHQIQLLQIRQPPQTSHVLVGGLRIVESEPGDPVDRRQLALDQPFFQLLRSIVAGLVGATLCGDPGHRVLLDSAYAIQPGV